MDDLNLSSTVGQTSWQYNLFSNVLFTILLLISLYFLAKLYYNAICDLIQARKEAFQAMKKFYAILTKQNIKKVVSCLGLMIYCFYMMFFYILISPFHALSWESSTASFRSIKPIYLVFSKVNTPSIDWYVTFSPKQQDCRQDMITNKFISKDITGYLTATI